MKVELEIAIRGVAMAYFKAPSQDSLDGSWDERERVS